MEYTIRSINSVFREALNWQNDDNVKLRNRKISILDAIKYKFFYSEINKTKSEITSSINFDNGNKISTTSFYRKERNISIQLYENILVGIRKIFNKVCDKNSISIISVDGTFTNTDISKGKISTNLNMGYYDVTNDAPFDLQFIGDEKNTEIEQLKKYLNSHNLNGTIIVADRAYFKYELFKQLNDSGIKFVIRIKNNSNLLKEPSDINKYCKNKELIETFKKNFRIVKCEFNSHKEFTSRKKTKYDIDTNSIYNLVTNLTNANEYTDDKIKSIYNSRWSIELFFKLIKSKFKFSYTNEKEIQFKKTILVEMIIIYLCKIIKKIFLKNNKISTKIKRRKTNNYVDVSVNINESNLISGFFAKLLNRTLNGTLNNFMNSYIVVVKNELNRHFPRMCKCPFKKWYVKFYHEVYKYNKISKGCNELDKNLKLKSKNITVTIK